MSTCIYLDYEHNCYKLSLTDDANEIGFLQLHPMIFGFTQVGDGFKITRFRKYRPLSGVTFGAMIPYYKGYKKSIRFSVYIHYWHVINS